MIDLHMHTTYSDGRAAPEEVVKHAASIGLKHIAITDHDNVRGNREARAIAEAEGIELIPAVEMTTYWEGFNSVDLLGYFMDFDNENFLSMLEGALDDLRQRITACCGVISEMGYPVTYDELEQLNPHYCGSGHIIYQIHDQKHLVETYAQGLSLFAEAWTEVPRCALNIEDAIRTINDAGGVAVLAHPARIRTELLSVEELRPLAEAGLGGIEVYHPSADEAISAHYIAVADVLGLVKTGGSDEHGYPEGFPRMGTQPVTEEMLDALRERAKRRA